MIDKIKKNQDLWDLYSCREEYHPSFTDRYGRYPHYLSTHRTIFEPSVSKFIVDNGVTYDYPDGQPFALCITHDIDTVYERSMVRKGVKTIRLIGSGYVREGVKSAMEIPLKRRPWWNFRDIVTVEKVYGAKSTFFFMAIDSQDLDWNYEISDLENEIVALSEEGWGIGLHGGHVAYEDPIRIGKEKKALEKILGRELLGYRNHYLRFVVPNTWEALSACGFKYDSTYGYADCVGFRNGMCHPFKPYNLSKQKEIEIIEIPLTIMDGTLFGDYMRLSTDVAWQITKQLIDEVEKCNGVITILWHNTNMFSDDLKFFKKILEYCYNKKAWLASSDEIYEWFSKMNIL